MNNKYLFSIIIPVYNTERYLPRAINSILNQTFDIKKIEVIVVNDCSPNSAKCDQIISEYNSKININYIQLSENKGTHIARMTGVKSAKGKYTLFLDPDDEYNQETCKDLYFYTNNDEFDYIYFTIKIKSTNSQDYTLPIDIRNKDKNINMIDLLSEKIKHCVFDKCYNTIFLKYVVNKMQKFYGIFAEDYYESIMIEYYKNKIFYIDKSYYIHNQFNGITSNTTFNDFHKVKKINSSIISMKNNLLFFFQTEQKEFFIKYLNDYIMSIYENILIKSTSYKIHIYILKYVRFSIFVKILLTKIKNKIKKILKFIFLNKI